MYYIMHAADNDWEQNWLLWSSCARGGYHNELYRRNDDDDNDDGVSLGARVLHGWPEIKGRDAVRGAPVY
jgi:hypothetical protein